MTTGYQTLPKASSSLKTAIVVLALAFMVAGCAPAALPAKPPPAPPPALAATPTPSAASPGAPPSPTAYEKVKVEFDKVIAAAKKEGKLTWYTVTALDAVANAWDKKYPDIKLEVVNVTSAVLRTRIEAEQQAKAYAADFVSAGVSAEWELKTRGYMAKSNLQGVLPSLHDPNAKWMTKVFVDPDGFYISGFMGNVWGPVMNTKLVPSDKEPKSWADLTDAYWKGKLLMRDPSSAGAGTSLTLVLHRILGEDYLKKLAEQKPTMSPASFEEAVKMVARGEYPLMVAAGVEDVAKLPADVPVKLLSPKEGVVFTDSGFGLIKNGPHPNAALVFGDFLLSREGQEAIASLGRIVARADVSLPNPKFQDLTGKTLLTPTEDEVLNKGPKLTAEAKIWFGLD